MKRFLLCASLSLLPLQADTIPLGTNTSQINASADEKNYRQRSIRAYLPLKEVSRRLKVGNYSSFENPTGIYFKQGERARITLDAKATAGAVTLIVHEFGAAGHHHTYPLSAGLNELTMANSGLAYLDYRSMKPQSAPELKVQIEGGQINGLFTEADDNKTWKRLLANAKCSMIDIIGPRVHLVYHVEELRKHCPEKGAKLLAVYEEIMKLEQDIMGLELYKLHPGNHIMGRNIWRGFMHADGMGAAFHHNTMGGIGNPDKARKGSWGIAHEFGHVNQVRPAMTWVGTTEITTNIYSAWANYKLNPANMRLEHEVTPSPNGNMRGGRMHSYVHSAIVQKRPWQFQIGPDYTNYGKESEKIKLADEVKRSKGNFDHFTNLSPMWQLQLYMEVAGRAKNFYPQIFQAAREADTSKLTHGQMRLNFVKAACDASKLNLTEFFVRTGILRPINRWKEDYGSRMLTLTPAMVKEAITHAHKYPKPDSRVIYYINSNNVGIYRDKTPLQQGRSYTPQAGKITIPAGDWKGAVAFEVYAGKKLVGVSLLGLGHQNNASTDIFIPSHASSVQAVAWDGARLTVYKEDEKK